MTSPLPQSERQAAQVLGRERLQVFVAPLVSKVLETKAADSCVRQVQQIRHGLR